MSNLLFDPIKAMSRVTDSVIVSFSGGKDSIVTLDLCCRYFKNVYVYFMYLVPDLEFQNKMLGWYEQHYNIKIVRVPHFELSAFYRYGSFRQYDEEVSNISITDIYEYVRQESGYYWIAAGERAKDSIIRNAMIKKSGSIDAKRGRMYPIAWWDKKEILQYIKQKKLYLSKEQKEIGFSFRSLDGMELLKIRELYPNDYEKILKCFPFASAGVKRAEMLIEKGEL